MAENFVSRLSTPASMLDQLTDDDCMRTSIAMLLGFDDASRVPNFYRESDSPEETWARLDGWLGEHGLAAVCIPVNDWSIDDLQTLSFFKKISKALLLGAHGSGGHMCAVVDGRIVETREPRRQTCLIGPGESGYWWLTLLVPAVAPT